MKVDDFLKHVPGQLTVDEVIAAVEEETEPEHVTSLTPSGLEVYYQWSPRLYRVRHESRQLVNTLTMTPYTAPLEWREVPSVTTVLNILDKSGALTYWGNKIGAEGVIELVARGRLVWAA